MVSIVTGAPWIISSHASHIWKEKKLASLPILIDRLYSKETKI